MKRPLMSVAAAIMALSLGACNNAEDDSSGENDQELPAETDETTDDNSENDAVTENEGDDGDDVAEPADPEDETENETEDGQEEENGVENEDDTVAENIDLLFYDEEAANMYRETRTVTAASEEELPAAAVEEWLNGPESDELTPPISEEGAHVQYVEDQDGTAHISFSPEITDANFGSAAEVAFLDQVAQIMVQFGFDSTQFLLDGDIQESLFGHSDTSDPYVPEGDLDGYDEIDG